MDFLLDPNIWIAFAMLTALEIVLGVDNIIFISILVGRLPPSVRDKARRLGLGFAMVSRLLLLFSLSWVMGLTDRPVQRLGPGHQRARPGAAVRWPVPALEGVARNLRGS
jgi:predicted tellurium resistance membrane protein TerC